MPKKQRIYDYFSEFASEALHIVIFENFVKSMTSCLSKLKVTTSFCFAFKIPDNVTASRLKSNEFEWLGINPLSLSRPVLHPMPASTVVNPMSLMTQTRTKLWDWLEQDLQKHLKWKLLVKGKAFKMATKYVNQFG